MAMGTMMATLRAGILSLSIAALALAAAGLAAAEPRPPATGGVRAFAIESVGWPWQAIGRVNLAGKGFCTGTLVARDVVLTAAHCLFERGSKRRFQPHELTFLSGYQRGEAQATSRATSVHIAPGFVVGSPHSVERIANDWALLRLAEPLALPPVAVRPLALAAPAAEAAKARPAAMLSAGYGRERAHMLTVHDGCTIASRLADDRVLVHDCEVTRGGSGSPLLARDARGYTLVGIVVGSLSRAAERTAFGVHAAAFAPALADINDRDG